MRSAKGHTELRTSSNASHTPLRDTKDVPAAAAANNVARVGRRILPKVLRKANTQLSPGGWQGVLGRN